MCSSLGHFLRVTKNCGVNGGHPEYVKPIQLYFSKRRELIRVLTVLIAVLAQKEKSQGMCSCVLCPEKSLLVMGSKQVVNTEPDI